LCFTGMPFCGFDEKKTTSRIPAPSLVGNRKRTNQ